MKLCFIFSSVNNLLARIDLLGNNFRSCMRVPWYLSEDCFQSRPSPSTRQTCLYTLMAWYRCYERCKNSREVVLLKLPDERIANWSHRIIRTQVVQKIVLESWSSPSRIDAAATVALLTWKLWQSR